MSTNAKPRRLSLLALSMSALFAFAPSAAARNVFDNFSKAPTFTPPAGCSPTEQTYGVTSRCEKQIESGRTFVALIDTAMGWFGDSPSADATEIFVRDHVADIRAYWREYPGKNLAFSSKVSEFTPGGAPLRRTNCMEYSLTIETERTTGGQPTPAVMRLEGLTCAWLVEDAAPGKANIELFWLEGYDEYVPSIGQKPMESFDPIVRELFASARLLVPRAYLVPTSAAKNAMLDWTESDVNACFGAGTKNDVIAGMTRYLYARADCKLFIMFRNGKVHSVEGNGSEQECWWVMDACERGTEYQEAPRDRWQRWTLEDVAACFGEPTEDPTEFNVYPMQAPSKDNAMQMERDGCNMSVDLESTQRLSIYDWSEKEKGACRRVLRKCEEIEPSKF